jgi:aminoglycoside phosphotransferase (APT) family kinase protein
MPLKGPPAGEHNFYRSGQLKIYDSDVRTPLTDSGLKFDSKTIAKVWDEALSSTWSKPPVWIHGDIACGNLLVKNGRLSAVIDFGCLGIGDPACDLMIAYTLFDGPSRSEFKRILALDDETWIRAQAWTL